MIDVKKFTSISMHAGLCKCYVKVKIWVLNFVIVLYIYIILGSTVGSFYFGIVWFSRAPGAERWFILCITRQVITCIPLFNKASFKSVPYFRRTVVYRLYYIKITWKYVYGSGSSLICILSVSSASSLVPRWPNERESTVDSTIYSAQ